jgi:hypothetical protein
VGNAVGAFEGADEGARDGASLGATVGGGTGRYTQTGLPLLRTHVKPLLPFSQHGAAAQQSSEY